MAREEHEREDLMRDAKALVLRAKIEFAANSKVVLGRNARGGASFYFGEDPVFHLNSHGELRRAYVGGRLFKAEAGRLIEMERVRTPDQVELRSRALSPSDQNEFIALARQRLAEIVASVERGAYTLVAEVPNEGKVVGQVVEWLRDHLAHPLEIASVPNAI